MTTVRAGKSVVWWLTRSRASHLSNLFSPPLSESQAPDPHRPHRSATLSCLSRKTHTPYQQLTKSQVAQRPAKRLVGCPLSDTVTPTPYTSTAFTLNHLSTNS